MFPVVLCVEPILTVEQLLLIYIYLNDIINLKGVIKATYYLFQFQTDVADIQLQYIAIWMFFFQEEELVTNALPPFISVIRRGSIRRSKAL